MHDRNVFSTNKPDFERLALEYKEFAPYVQKGKSGKSYVNFKDPASLRALSVVLLKKYFDLTIEIPLDKLIPTIPLRLNYIHWVEDLLMDTGYKERSGIDIGCGASCVYPLLGCKLNQWKFIATEINEEAMKYAVENVKRNNMKDFVTVLKVSKENPPLKFATHCSNNVIYDFCMCNPPFYSDVYDAVRDRTDHRPPPASISTASELERCTKGGEVEFVKKVIVDSMTLKGKIRWYTTMIGKKSSMKPLIKCLVSNDINIYDTATFKQGRTMRWGIAWSFTESLPKKQAGSKTKKKVKPFIFLPSDTFYVQNHIPIATVFSDQKSINAAMAELVKFLSNEFSQLKIDIDDPAFITLQGRGAYEITGRALRNTWTHQRRKRREIVHGHVDNYSIPAGSNSHDIKIEHSIYSPANTCRDDFTSTNKRKVESIEENYDNLNCKRFCDELGDNLDVKEIRKSTGEFTDLFDEGGNHLFGFSCSVGRTSQFNLDCSDSIVLSFLCLEGDRDQFHQMFLYFKNVMQGSQLKVNYKI